LIGGSINKTNVIDISDFVTRFSLISRRSLCLEKRLRPTKTRFLDYSWNQETWRNALRGKWLTSQKKPPFSPRGERRRKAWWSFSGPYFGLQEADKKHSKLISRAWKKRAPLPGGRGEDFQQSV
jgi:hypothetical protein